MGIVSNISDFINMLLTATIIMALLAGAVLFYFIKIKKIASKEEKIDYSTFYRRDSTEYLKFDDIITDSSKNSFNGKGSIVVNNGNTFIAGIDVIGYHFPSAAAAEKQSTMMHYISFFNLVESKIQFRQAVRRVDMSSNISSHQKIQKQLALEIMELEDQYSEAMANLENSIDEEEEYNKYERIIKSTEKLLAAKRWMIGECGAVLSYMNGMSKGNDGDSDRVNHIFFSWHYNPNDYTEEQSEESIYLKALHELNTRANAYINAMERCGCTCSRLTCGEIINLLRKHMNPMMTEDIKPEDIFNSSYNSLFVTSDSLLDYEKQKRTDEEYKKLLDELNGGSEKKVREDELRARRNERLLMEKVKSTVDKERFDPSVALMKGEIYG